MKSLLKHTILAFITSSAVAFTAQAATFSINPQGGAAKLPTVVVQGQTAVALYTLTNTSGKTLNNYSFRSLPANSSQSTATEGASYSPALCNSPINLSASASCTLKLAVTNTSKGGFLICDNDGRGNQCTAYTQYPLNVTSIPAEQAPAHINLSLSRSLNDVINVPTDGSEVTIALTNNSSGDMIANNINVNLSNFGNSLILDSRSNCDAFAPGSVCTIKFHATKSFSANSATIQGSNTNQISVTLKPQSPSSSVNLIAMEDNVLLSQPNEAQIFAFFTDPVTNGVVVNINTADLPAGVTTSAASCTTTDIHEGDEVYPGACYVTLTASSTAHGSNAVDITGSLSGYTVNPPSPLPTVAVQGINITINNGNPIGIDPETTIHVQITNNGPFTWNGINLASTLANVDIDPTGDPTNCITHPPASGASCTVSLGATVSAQRGTEGLLQASGGNLANSPTSQTLFVKGEVTASLNNTTLSTVTSVSTLSIINSSTSSTATVSGVNFTHGSGSDATIHGVSMGGSCSTIEPGNSCEITLSPTSEAYGSDTLTVHYTLTGSSTPLLATTPDTLNVAGTHLTLSGSGASATAITLQPNQANQQYTITAAPFAWQNPQASVGPEQGNNFFTFYCNSTTSACTVTFDTTHISSLPPTEKLSVSGDNIDPTSSWSIVIGSKIWSDQFQISSNQSLQSLSCTGSDANTYLCGATNVNNSGPTTSYISAEPQNAQNPNWPAAMITSTGSQSPISCPDKHLCMSINTALSDSSIDPPAGEVFANTTPTTSGGSWTSVGTLKNGTDYNKLHTIACTGDQTSGYVCVVDDDYGYTFIGTSTDGGSQWTWSNPIQISSDLLPSIQTISCADKTLCAMIDSNSKVYSINPSDQYPSWTDRGTALQLMPDYNSTGPSGLSCVKGGSPANPLYMCAATISEMNQANEKINNIVTTANLTASTGTEWKTTYQKSTTDGHKSFPSISCADSSLCVVADGSGNVLTSTTPTAGNWIETRIIPNNYYQRLWAVSCTGTQAHYLCAVVDEGGYGYVSTNPAAVGIQASRWKPLFHAKPTA